MNYRKFGKIGWEVSEIGFGAWAIGSLWGAVNDDQSMAAMHRALDLGINLIDTADVYGDGHSEKLIAQLKKERKENFYVIAKVGRRLSPHTADGYTAENLNAFVDRCRKNLQSDCLDMVQLQTPPTEVYYRPEVFEALDDMVSRGKIQYYGVSVEKVEEALKAIEYPGVQSVQIIFNMFRHRPAELFFKEAERRKVAIIARVPLASGLLTGKFTPNTKFSVDDHRNFNRHGASFDRGETFSGVDYHIGLNAVEELKTLVSHDSTMAQFALRWILMFNEVTCAIPGGKTPAQVEDNAAAADLPALSRAKMAHIRTIYDEYIRNHVHHRW